MRGIIRCENPVEILKFGIIFLICLSVSGGCVRGKHQIEKPRAVHGVLDLGDWDFDRDGLVCLDGQWAFFWKQLLGPGDPFPGENPGYAPVPGIWHRIRIKGKPISDKGFATYRLRVVLKKPGGLYALRMKEVFSAYRIWVNGDLIYSCGEVGETGAVSVPKYASHATSFHVKGNQLLILLQVSNYKYMKGGISDPIEFGPAALIQAERERSLVIDYTLFGSLLIMAAYHFALFLLRKEDLSTLLFGLFCLIMASRILVADDGYLVALLPSLPWELRLKILVLGYYLGLPVFASFINTLYPAEYCSRAMKGIQVVGLAASVMVLVTAPQFFTRTEIFYQGFILLSSLYFLYGILRAMIRKKSGAGWIVLGFLALFVTVLNDILYAQNVAAFSRFQNLLPIGLFFFIFSQSYILSVRFSNAFKKANVDELCQVANRRRFLELAEYEFMKFERSRVPLSVMTMDVDHFKRVNDTYGHDVGDLVLKTLAKTVSGNIRKQDVFGRMGGEEFSLLLPGLGKEMAVTIADRLRQRIRGTDIPVKKHQVRVSVSIGIAVMDQSPHKVDVMLKQADLALYQAKDGGRDRVVLWEEPGLKGRQCPGAA